MFINFKQLSNNIADIRSYIGHLYVGRVLGSFDQGGNQFPCRFGAGESLVSLNTLVSTTKTELG